MDDLTPNQRLEGVLVIDPAGPTTQAIKIRDPRTIGHVYCYITPGRNGKLFATIAQGPDRLIVMKPKELRDLAKWCEGAAVILENVTDG